MTQYDDVRAAIAADNLEQARNLLRNYYDEHQDDAEMWYLMAQAAINDEQTRYFLEQAVDRDPLHAEAGVALYELTNPQRVNPYAEQQAPENTASTDDTVTFGKRAMAFLFDTFLIVGGIFITTMVLNLIMTLFITSQPMRDAFATLTLFIALLQAIGYQVYFLTQQNGQTVGKSTFGLRVVKRDGTDITVWDAVLRGYLGYLMSAIPLGLGYFWIFYDVEGQTWHDKLANTEVISATEMTS